MAEEVKKVEHKNIFEALSAFQGENPEIVKNGEVTFGEGAKQVKFKYAELGDIFKVVRPLLAKHGLAVMHEGNDKGEIVCALYHTSYKVDVKELKTSTDFYTDGVKDRTEVVENKVFEEGVIRSLPIKVRREGVMKDIGSDSTYARRYTLAEVLGIASDEDKDIAIQEASKKNVETYAFRKMEEGIITAKKEKEVLEKIDFLKKEIETVKGGKKAPDLGMKLDQYERLLVIAENALAKLKGEPVVTPPEEDLPPQEDADTGAVDIKDLPEDLGGEKK